MDKNQILHTPEYNANLAFLAKMKSNLDNICVRIDAKNGPQARTELIQLQQLYNEVFTSEIEPELYTENCSYEYREVRFYQILEKSEQGPFLNEIELNFDEQDRLKLIITHIYRIDCSNNTFIDCGKVCLSDEDVTEVFKVWLPCGTILESYQEQ